MGKTDEKNTNMKRTGHPKGISFRIEWDKEFPPNASLMENTLGHLKLWVGDDLIWGLADEKKGTETGVYWEWIALLEFLCMNWAYFCHEENHILSFKAIRNKGDSENIRELQSIYDFRDRHNLARCVKGMYIQPVLLMREGSQILIATKNGLTYRRFEETISTLRKIGDFICERIRGLKDEQAEYWVELWANKDNGMGAEEKNQVITDLSALEISELQGETSSVQFWESDNEDPMDVSEIQAAARMARGVPLKQMKNIIESVRNISKKPTSLLDDISAEALGFLVGKGHSRLHEQGYSLAKWLRNELDVPDDKKVSPEAILKKWNIHLDEITLNECPNLQAVSCWGPKHGPAIIINDKGTYNKLESGKRATLAHEICHLLVDREKSLPLVEILGGDSPYGVEKRANAFAAELLMPRTEVEKTMDDETDVKKAIKSLSSKFAVGHILVANQIENSNIDLNRDDLNYIKMVRNKFPASPLFDVSIYYNSI